MIYQLYLKGYQVMKQYFETKSIFLILLIIFLPSVNCIANPSATIVFSGNMKGYIQPCKA